MTRRGELDRWLLDSEWVADRDLEVSPDAMRCHPQRTSSFDPLPISPRPHQVSDRPALDRAQIRRLMLEANARWVAAGRAYDDLRAGQP